MVNPFDDPPRRVIPIRPACFDSDTQWAGWLDSARTAKTVMVENVHCQDCSPDYQARMVAAKRCGNPTYQFVKEPDDEGSQ